MKHTRQYINVNNLKLRVHGVRTDGTFVVSNCTVPRGYANWRTSFQYLYIPGNTGADRFQVFKPAIEHVNY